MQTSLFNNNVPGSKKYLVKDVISGKKQVYGRKDELVKIIVVHAPAVIVEGIKGNRFSTTLENLSEIGNN